MKLLNEEQVNYVRQEIKKLGTYSPDLVNELTDHICSMIEERDFEVIGFAEVHKRVVDEFVPSNFKLIQDLSNRIIHHKNNNKMKRIKLSMAVLMAYSTFIMLLSLFIEPVNVLRMSGCIIYAATTLLFAIFLIRFKLTNLNLKLIAGVAGYFLSLFLIVLGLGETNPAISSSLLKVMPYISMGVLSSCAFFYYRFKKAAVQ
jgi:hypothetical protein